MLQTLLSAQKEAIYQAFLDGDMQKWKTIILHVEKKDNIENTKQLELINYQYGYIGWCISQGKNQEAKKYLNKARAILKELDKKGVNKSILLAYKAAFVGFDIGLAPYKAPFIGPQSLEFAETAIKIDPNNPMAYAQLGNIAYYTPKMFGGSKTKALSYYTKAMELLEKSPDQIQNNWNYLNLLATTIEAYIGINDFAKAKQLYNKTVKIAPHFMWINTQLYPQIKKHEENE